MPVFGTDHSSNKTVQISKSIYCCAVWAEQKLPSSLLFCYYVITALQLSRRLFHSNTYFLLDGVMPISRLCQVPTIELNCMFSFWVEQFSAGSLSFSATCFSSSTSVVLSVNNCTVCTFILIHICTDRPNSEHRFKFPRIDNLCSLCSHVRIFIMLLLDYVGCESIQSINELPMQLCRIKSDF